MKVVFGLLFALVRVAVLGGPPAATLSVRVVPALDPRGGAWIVQLFEESSERRKPVDERPVDANGAWSTSAARYGVFYRLRIATQAGDGWYADDKPFELDPDRGPRVVRLASSAFRATLVLGKKPLSGRVTFTDRDGLVAVPFVAKTDGTFEGVLPRDGWWSVAVAADRPHFKTTFDVRVDPVFRDGTPPDVEIRVRSKVIQGEIVDLKNAPVPVASLSVSGFQEPLKVEGGWFTWDKVVDGTMTLHATARGLNGFDSSAFRTVRVSGGWVDPGFLSLEIRPTYVLKGRTVFPSGEPAAGARIRLLSPFYEIRMTPADGRFQMTIRGGGENACLLVVDPSKAARLVPVPASESEQDVPVAASPGTLSLEFTPRGERRFARLAANGCKLPSFFFPEIAGAKSAVSGMTSTFSFRASAGAYSFCGLEYGELEDDAEIPPEACVSGVLPPGGTLSLRLNP